MRKTTILSLALTMSVGAFADNQPSVADTATVIQMEDYENLLSPIKPTYLKGALVDSPWSGHWFVQAAGGATALLGKPLGCNDLFGRIEPAFHVSVGKWFTPSIGGRLDYGGMRISDCLNNHQDYQYMRADLMWNVLGNRYTDDVHSRPRWSVIPFAGVGMLHNKDNGQKPFAISLGIQAQYHVSNRIAIVAEVGDMFTMQDFDGYGKAHRLGDNLLSASLGLSVSLGKTSWKRTIDARPYISQNERLYDYATTLREQNDRLRSQHEQDALAREQLRKILAIEGLLDKYDHLFDYDATLSATSDYPKNDYSGLNSLKARMKNRGKMTQPTKQTDASDCADKCGTSNTHDADDYLTLIQSGEICLGAPIYFFFNLGTANLVNSSQLINLDEVARIAKKYGLSVRVIGAADSATGTTTINNGLSQARANYIATELQKRGMDSGNITIASEGGIDEYSPNEANRHTRIMLYWK